MNFDLICVSSGRAVSKSKKRNHVLLSNSSSIVPQPSTVDDGVGGGDAQLLNEADLQLLDSVVSAAIQCDTQTYRACIQLSQLIR